jgi:DNA polymerase-4
MALKVKTALREQIGAYIRCSIGLAPNVFLGKVATDFQKPDGLVVVTNDVLPGVFSTMKLRSIYGIGPRMEQRFNQAGIFSFMDLWNTPSSQMRRIWGGIHGVLFYEMLHGADLQPPSSVHSKSMGHQHVLEPELRTLKGAKNFAHHLLAKAAERLRRHDYYCRRLGVSISWAGHQGGWWDDVGFHETRDTGFLLARLEELWARVPPMKPLKVGVVLLGLVPATRHQGDLFAVQPRQQKLSPMIDRINQKFGRNTIGFGLLPPTVQHFKGHAAFQRVPEEWEF